MIYGLEQGPSESKIIEQCIRQRRPLPDSIKNAPELRLGLELFYLAFMDLGSGRQLTDTVPGPIPWSDVQRYCEVYDITGEQREDLFYYVQQMDKSYLEWCEARVKKIAEQHRSKAAAKSRRR